jgi:hypothetical protein
MSLELLIEHLTPEESHLIVEASQDAKNVWLRGTFMQAAIKNRNGRVYPINEISAAVQIGVSRIKESKGLLGELDHPQTLSINLDRVSHVITEMRMVGNNAVGGMKLINSPMGNIAKELVNSGVLLGVSSRGAGSVNESGGVTGFQFVTVDIVAIPSAPGAIPNAVYESLQMAKNGTHIMNLSEAVQHDPAAQQYFKREMLKWLETGLFAKKS